MDDNLSKWLEGELSNEELKKNIGSEDIAKYQQIIDEVDKWVPDNSNQLFDPKDISNKPKQARVQSMQSWVPYSIAASLVMAIASYFLFFNSSSIVTHTTGISEVKEVVLPDGESKIFLAPNSEISWDKEDWSQSQVAERVKLKKKHGNRKVKLKGKALFKVAKGDPFSVSSPVGSVEVLGTTFEVDEFGNGMNVICFEGKVRAIGKKGNEVIVNGGDGYLLFNGVWEDRVAVNESLPSWLENETKFENAPLSQVIKSLEKLYGITFDTGSTNTKRRFTGTIPNDKINVALRIVFDPFNIKYERKGDMLYLTEK